MLTFSRAIVSGGSSGIGRALVELLLHSEIEVISLSRSRADFSGHINFNKLWQIPCDITDERQLAAAFELIRERWDYCDLLFSNAGFGISGSVAGTNKQQMIRQFDLNFFSSVSLIQQSLPLLRMAGAPRIILTSSVAGAIAIPYQLFYSASKASLNSLSLALNAELAPDKIKTIAVMPGDCQTDFTNRREKNAHCPGSYAESELRSVSKMEEDERNGYPPDFVAGQIFRYANKKRPKPLYGVGLTYRLLLTAYKLLPTRLTNMLVTKLYG